MCPCREGNMIKTNMPGGRKCDRRCLIAMSAEARSKKVFSPQRNASPSFKRLGD